MYIEERVPLTYLQVQIVCASLEVIFFFLTLFLLVVQFSFWISLV